MTRSKNLKPLYFIETLILTSALWFVLSGIFELKFIVYGLISCLIISIVCMRGLTVTGIKTGKEYYLLHFNYIRMIKYLAWLLKEIVNAALYVTKLITRDYSKMQAAIVWFKADYDNPLARTLLANSITITPGTVTVDIFDNGIYSVHAISDELREGVLSGDMQARVAAVFGETIDFKVIKVVNADDSVPARSWRKKGNLRKRRIGK